MARLRIDPWDPEYGGSIEIGLEEEHPADVDADVEGVAWEAVGTPADATPPALPRIAFIDGVRRIDLALFAEEGEVTAPALAGSWAVGCARSGRPPDIGEVVVGRALVVGAGLTAQALEPRIGGMALRYAAVSVVGGQPTDPLRGLQNGMRQAEADLAARLASRGGTDLVVVDGPLSYFVQPPAIGLVKRQSRAYLDPERAGLIARLRPGQRTPLFAIKGQQPERYSWYLRLAQNRPVDGAMVGIVRLEAPCAIGMDGVRELAELAGRALPAFAPAPGRDPRAPQNLYPVGQLERALRHRLGDALLVRRALEATLTERHAHAA